MPLRDLVISASVWTVIGMALSNVLRLITNIILAKLLFPEAFGLMALVFIFVQGLQLLSDIGIGPSIIQHERGDEPTFLNTAWTLQILRGIMIWLCLLLIYKPAAQFYSEPMLLWLIPVVGFSAVIAGFESTARFTLNRHLQLKQLAMLEVGSQFAAVPVMVLWAYISPSVWALACGSLVTASVRVCWSHLLIKGQRNRLHWNTEAASAVIHFGKWIFISTAIGYFAEQIDRILLGKLIPLDVLGLYSIAFMLHRVPNDLVAQLGYKVMFPAVTKMLHLPRAELRLRISRVRHKVLIVLAAAIALLAVTGDFLIWLLYDERYQSAGWMLQLLVIGLWPRILINTLGPALLALGKPNYFAYSSALRLVVLIVAIPIFHTLYGLFGVICVVAVGGLVDYIVESYGLWRHGLLLITQDLSMTVMWVLMLLLFLIVREASGFSVVAGLI